MVFEIARIVVREGMTEQFEEGVRLAAPHFQELPGCSSLRLQRVIEDPQTYLLVVGWESVDDHMVTFRASEGFTLWRELVGPCFAEPPFVQHVETVIDAF